MTIAQADLKVILKKVPSLHAIHLENVGPTGKTFQKWHLTTDDQETVCGFLVSETVLLGSAEAEKADCGRCFGGIHMGVTDKERNAILKKE